MSTPTATYRLQVNADFGFDDAAAQVPYLTSLGVSHLYLSPILQPVPGSSHGYDVIRHDQLNAEAGGREAFDRLVAAAHAAGLGMVVDVVPNHMAVPGATHLNQPLWEVLRDGPSSPSARWFDIDWDAAGGRVVLPILGDPLAEVSAAGDLQLVSDGGAGHDEWALRYFEHEFPVAAGSERLPLAECVDAQHYLLTHWREGAAQVNYRRFFDINSLIAVRVEDPVVFEHTHRLLLDLHASGAIDGFRIDHPDGLADPRGYLNRLAEATGGAWVVAEKILEGDEDLPRDWACAGTTGYDALLRVQQALTPAAGADALTRVWDAAAPAGDHVLSEVIVNSKREVVAGSLAPEVERLLRCFARLRLPGDDEAAQKARHQALTALLVSMDRYRAYLVPGQPAHPDQVRIVDAAVERARALLSGDHDAEAALAEIRDLVTDTTKSDGPRAEAVIRFGQTCGPVMAKGIEDTAFYRWLRMVGANEVGGHPDQLSITPDEFHDWMQARQQHWPSSMTALTTHDTKRSEDVRARLMALAESAEEWSTWVDQMRKDTAAVRDSLVDEPTAYLIWQTLIGAWPISTDRLDAYLLKAVREAKVRTAWVDGNADYERAVLDYAGAVLRSDAARALIERWLSEHAASVRANVLGQKLLQLTAVGVPDIYQGSEREVTTLVDPDNRGAVDFDDLASRLARIDGDHPEADLGDEKLRVTATALRVRRARPSAWVGATSTYHPIATTSEHLLAFARGDEAGLAAVVVVTRGADTVTREGGWAEHSIDLPEGQWRNRLSRNASGALTGQVRIAALLDDLPVALLERTS